MTANLVNVLMGGLFHAAILFLVAAGLQVVFGVQKIFNLACGSFYALGAYTGVSAVAYFTGHGGPPALFILPLALGGLAVGLIGIVVERGLLRFVYDRDETFQLLLTFALVLMLEDLIRMTWGTAPVSTGGLYLSYGQARLLGATVPVYNLIVIAASLAIAIGIGWLLTRTAFGRIIRASADNREMAEALVVAPTYYVTLMLPFMAYGVILLGLNLLFGYTGLVSFGHALFIGVGAYTGAVMTTHLHVRHMEVILPAAALAAAIVAAPVGALCVRYVKIYFGMLTLAFGMVFYTFLLKFYKLTGGDEGMRMLRPYLLGSGWEGFSKTAYLVGPYYYFSLGILILATLLMWRVVRSPFGLCLKTIRDNPLKAESLGVSVPRFRWYAFMISAVYAAVGGALLATPTGNVDPTLAYWTHSGNVVFMVLLGGFSSFFGPLLGAFAFIFLQDTVMSVFPYWRLVFGAMLAFIVIFAPSGLMGLFARRHPAQASRG